MPQITPNPADETNDEPDIEEDSIEYIRASIKEGLKQAFRGETVPLETLWTDDDEDLEAV